MSVQHWTGLGMNRGEWAALDWPVNKASDRVWHWTGLEVVPAVY